MDEYTLRDMMARILADGGLEDMGVFLSTYQGTVVDNEDPDGLRRVKVAVPEVSSRPIESWALPKVGNMGANQGADLTPDKGANVWVEFRMGSLDHPLYLPGWDSNGAKLDGASPTVRRVRTAKGEIYFDDETGELGFKALGKKEMLKITPDAVAALVGTMVDLGDENLTPLDGVVTGMCKCMYTGAPHIEVSLVVRAKK